MASVSIITKKETLTKIKMNNSWCMHEKHIQVVNFPDGFLL